MSGNENFDEYHIALDKIIQYAITYEIQVSCNGKNETYYIKDKLVATAKPPVSKWFWRVVPANNQPTIYEARLDGKTPDPKLSPQWIFHFLKEQHRFQARKMAVISTKASERASA